MASKWYYSMEGSTQLGPVTGKQLKNLAATGRLRPTHMVRKEDMEKLVRARRVKGLFAPPIM